MRFIYFEWTALGIGLLSLTSVYICALNERATVDIDTVRKRMKQRCKPAPPSTVVDHRFAANRSTHTHQPTTRIPFETLMWLPSGISFTAFVFDRHWTGVATDGTLIDAEYERQKCGYWMYISCMSLCYGEWEFKILDLSLLLWVRLRFVSLYIANSPVGRVYFKIHTSRTTVCVCTRVNTAISVR